MSDRPKEIERSLTIQLLRTREAVMAHFRPLLQSLDVTEQQWRVLRCLYPDIVSDAARLAHDAAILPPSLTRILKLLETNGLVTIQRPQDDRRKVEIRLSPKGVEFIGDALPESRRIYSAVRQAVGEVRMDYLYDLLSETARLCEELSSAPPESAEGEAASEPRTD